MRTTRTLARSASTVAIVGALALGGAACASDDDTGGDTDMVETEDTMDDTGTEDMMDDSMTDESTDG